jgi:integrase
MPRTGENIYLRKDGRWEGRYQVPKNENEKTRYHSVYGESYHDVKEKMIDAIVRQRTGTEVTPARPQTISNVTLIWLEYVKFKVRKTTFAKYDSIIRAHILPRLGDCEIDTIEFGQIQTYVSELLRNGRKDLKSGLSEKTAKDILVILKSIFKYAEQCGTKVGCRIDEISIHCPVKEVKVLSMEEQTKLSLFLQRDKDCSRIGVYLALRTGIRIGELAALRWEDIDFEQRILHIRRSLQRIRNLSNENHKTELFEGPPKTKNSVREIPLTIALINLLLTIKSSSRVYLMSGKTEPMEPRTIQNHFKGYLRECEIADTNFHVLRHSFATKCAEAGFDPKSLSELLGHSTVAITLNRYVHSSLQQKRMYMESLK